MIVQLLQVVKVKLHADIHCCRSCVTQSRQARLLTGAAALTNSASCTA